MSVPRPTYDGASYKPDEQVHRRRIADCITGIMAGKVNCVTDITLAAGVTTTTLTDPRVGYFTAILLMPMTANAAGALATTFIAQGTILKGSAVITHANAATVDRTFRVVILG